VNLSDLGEFGFLHHMAPKFLTKMPQGVEGIGNDCAVIPYSHDLSYLVTTDLLNENIHFIKEKIPPQELGYKALAVNLSDIAAMGGNPRYAFLALGMPPDTSLDWMDAFLEGFRQLAVQTDVLLLGGDTTKADCITLNVMIIGVIETAKIKRRSRASIGDLICCTGYLGDSGGGLKFLLENLPQDPSSISLIQAHNLPKPHLEEGAWLASQPGVHAMMDISDGLASDIKRIMELSHCGAHIEVDQLPLSPDLLHASKRFHWSPENIALTAGEDYCLLTTIDPQACSLIQEAYWKRFHRPLYRIGVILSGSSLIYTLHKKNFQPVSEGYDAFKSHRKN
jgi:thiamine-monophosphate kinase